MKDKIIKGTGLAVVLGAGITFSDDIVSPITAYAEDVPNEETSDTLSDIPDIEVEDPNAFKDAKLEALIRTTVGKPTGELTQADFDKVKTLTINDLEIKDLSDIRKFDNLTTLTITESGATSLDLSGANAKLTTFTFTNNTLLKDVNLGDKPVLTTVTGLKATSIESVSVGSAPLLSTISLDDTAKLRELHLKDMLKMASFSLTNSSIETIDVTGDSAPLWKSFVVSKTPNLKSVSFDKMPNLLTLTASYVNGATLFDIVDVLPTLQSLTLDNVEGLDLHLGLKTKLTTLAISNSTIKDKIDLSENPLKALVNFYVTNSYGVESSGNMAKTITDGVKVRPTFNIVLRPFTNMTLKFDDSDIHTLDFGKPDSGYTPSFSSMVLDGTYVDTFKNIDNYPAAFKYPSANATSYSIANSRIENFAQIMNSVPFANNVASLTLKNYPFSKLGLESNGQNKLTTLVLTAAPAVKMIDLTGAVKLTSVSATTLPNLEEIIADGDGLPKLTTATVTDTKITNLEFLSRSTGLLTLDLHSNLINDITALKDLKSLGNTNLADNMIQVIPYNLKSGNYNLTYNLISDYENVSATASYINTYATGGGDYNALLVGLLFVGNFIPDDLKIGTMSFGITLNGAEHRFTYEGSKYKNVQPYAANGYHNSAVFTDGLFNQLKYGMNLNKQDISSVESNQTVNMQASIKIPDASGGGAQVGTADYTKERVAMKIQKADQYFVDAEYGKVSNVRFEDGTLYYQYKAPQTLTDMDDTIMIQLVDGYQTTQTINIKGNDRTDAPNVVYTRDGDLKVSVAPNSDVTLYDAFKKKLEAFKADAKGNLLIDMDNYDIYNETFLVTAQEDGFMESDFSNVVYKDLYAPDVTLSYNISDNTEYATVDVEASDNVGLSAIDWVYGEKKNATYSDATLIKNNQFIVDKNGVYTVRATDVNGNTSLTYLNVDGLYEPFNIAPTITHVTASDAKSATVSIQDGNVGMKGNIIKYRINDDDWLTYKTPFKLNQNAKIEAKVLDKQGRETPITEYVVSDINTGYLDKPVITKVDARNYMLDTLPGYEYIVKNATQDYVVKTGVVPDTGNVKFTLKAPIKDGDAVDVIVRDRFGNTDVTTIPYIADALEADEYEVKVKAPYNVKALGDNTLIQGQGTPNSTMLLTNEDGDLVASTSTDKNGFFTIKLSENPQQMMYLQGVSATGYKTDAMPLDLRHMITNVAVGDDNMYISGSGTPGYKIGVLGTDGTVMTKKPVVIADDGSYTLDLTDDMRAQDVLILVYYTNDGSEVTRQTIYLGGDFTTPEITDDGAAFTGSSQKEIYVTITNGSDIVGVGYTAGGNYSVKLVNPIANGESYTYTIKDAEGAVLKSDTVMYHDTREFVGSAPVFDIDGTILSGVTKQNARYEVLTTDGTVVGTGKADSYGDVKYVFDKPVSDGSTYMVKFYDIDDALISYYAVKYDKDALEQAATEDKSKEDTEKEPVIKVVEQAPVYDDYTKTVSGITQPSNTITVVKDGKEYPVSVGTDGQYTYAFGQDLPNGTTYQVIVKDKDGKVLDSISKSYVDNYTFVDNTGGAPAPTVMYTVGGGAVSSIYYLQGDNSAQSVLSNGNRVSGSDITFTKNGVYSVVVKDRDGNTYYQSINVTNISNETKKPIVSISPNTAHSKVDVMITPGDAKNSVYVRESGASKWVLVTGGFEVLENGSYVYEERMPDGKVVYTDTFVVNHIVDVKEPSEDDLNTKPDESTDVDEDALVGSDSTFDGTIQKNAGKDVPGSKIKSLNDVTVMISKSKKTSTVHIEKTSDENVVYVKSSDTNNKWVKLSGDSMNVSQNGDVEYEERTVDGDVVSRGYVTIKGLKSSSSSSDVDIDSGFNTTLDDIDPDVIDTTDDTDVDDDIGSDEPKSHVIGDAPTDEPVIVPSVDTTPTPIGQTVVDASGATPYPQAVVASTGAGSVDTTGQAVNTTDGSNGVITDGSLPQTGIGHNPLMPIGGAFMAIGALLMKWRRK